MADVTILNASAETFSISVNHGPPVVVPGAEASKRWVPMASVIGLGLRSEAGRFGLGQNFLTLTSSMSGQWALSVNFDHARGLNDYQLCLFSPLSWVSTKWLISRAGEIMSTGDMQKND
jgi:hypothetical protein